MTAETSAGGQRTSGRASESDRITVLRCRLKHPVDVIEYRVLALESADSALVEVSCDGHADPSQASEMTAVVKRRLLCVVLPAPGFLGKSRQIFSHSRLERCHDHSRVSVTDA